MKLRNKIVVYMLPLILAPFLLTALAAYYFFISSSAEESQAARNRRVAEAVAEIRKDLRAAKRDLGVLKGVPAVTRFLREATPEHEAGARTALKLFFDQNPYYLELSLASKEGKEVVRYSRVTAEAPLRSFANEEFFRRTLISGRVQTPVEELAGGRHVTLLTEGINDGGFAGAVILSLNTDAFERPLRTLLAGQGLSSILFDDRGVVIAESTADAAEEECLRRQDLAKEAGLLLSDPPDEVAEKTPAADCSGYRFAVYPSEALLRTVYEPKPGENWFVGVLRKDEAPPGTTGFQVIFVIALGLSVAAVLYAAGDFARRITGPVEQFSEAAKQVARGDLEIDLDVSSGDEVEELAATFRKMTSDLQEYQEKTIRSAKLATIGELTSEISHEIQNRISGISLWLQYLDSEIEPGDPRREYIDEMKEGLDGFLEMLSNLKQYYRTPAPRMEEVEVGELLDSAVTYARAHAGGKNVEIVRSENGNVPAVSGDRELLRSVILNLVINAAESVENGGRVEVGAENGGGSVRIRVSDDGCGIREEDLARIFYPFFSTKPSGSGLGLAIASNVVDAHGGTVGVESVRGEGSVFTVTLPVPGTEESN